MPEEAHHAIDFFEGFAGRGGDNWEDRTWQFVREGAGFEVAAGHFDEIEPVLHDLVDRDLIPRSAHGEKAGLNDGVFDAPVLIPGEARLGEALHVFEIVPALKRGVDAAIDIAVLQFDAEGKRKSAGSRLQLLDDADAMVDIAHMIIGHLINKHRTPITVLHQGSPIPGLRD